jgi:hypothetical protein
MAQIIYLRQPEADNCKDETAFEARLSARLRESISDVKSSGDEVFLWVTELEANLNDLDVIADALVGPSQSRLREQIQFLRGRLSSALIELNLTLQNLPENAPNLRLCSLEQLAGLVARLSRAEVIVPAVHAVQQETEIDAYAQPNCNIPTALRG